MATEPPVVAVLHRGARRFGARWAARLSLCCPCCGRSLRQGPRLRPDDGDEVYCRRCMRRFLAFVHRVYDRDDGAVIGVEIHLCGGRDLSARTMREWEAANDG